MFDPRTLPANQFFVIAGPCVIESAEACLVTAKHLKATCDALGLPYIFKASFDKANRSSNSSFRGPGLVDGLAVLHRVRDELGIPVLTDIHEPEQADAVARIVDIIQIPAFLARQTDLLHAAGHTGKTVNIKKGQFMSPQEMKNAAEKVAAGGALFGKTGPIMLTERGTFFGYNRLVNDFTALAIMAELGYPTVFDVTHSTQQPAGLGGSSGGNPQFSPLLARSAIAAGVTGLFLECHPSPRDAKSDASTILSHAAADALLHDCAAIAALRPFKS